MDDFLRLVSERTTVEKLHGFVNSGKFNGLNLQLDDLETRYVSYTNIPLVRDMVEVDFDGDMTSEECK